MENYRFPAHQRLKTPRQFKQILNANNKIHGRFWIIFHAENELDDAPRLGVIVSKKTSLLAVKRNRLKRIAREFFRTNKADLPSCDILIIAKKTSVQYSRQHSNKLIDDLVTLKKKLHKLTD